MHAIRLGAGLLIAALLAVTGCSGGSNLAEYGGFTFTSPGGQSEFSYPAGERGAIGDLTGPDLAGDGEIKLSDYPGKVIVLNVWGSWCAPCRAETDDLTDAATRTADLPVQFLGIDVKDTRDGGRDFHTSQRVPYPSIFDPGMRTLLSIRGFPTSSIPATIILDRDHRVARIYLRVIYREEIIQAVTDLAAETPDDTAGSARPTTP